MSKMKKKRAVSLLLCLGIVATMSVGSLTVSADNTLSFDDEHIINTVYANDFIEAKDDTYIVNKEGYYLFLTDKHSDDNDSVTWYDALDKNSAGETDFTPLLSNFKKFGAGDELDFGEDDISVNYMLYKQSEGDAYTVYGLALSQKEEDPYADNCMFYWEFTEASEDKAVVHIKAEARGGANLSDYVLYLGDELYGDLSPDSDVTIPNGVSSYEFDLPLYDNGNYTLYMYDTFGLKLVQLLPLIA